MYQPVEKGRIDAASKKARERQAKLRPKIGLNLPARPKPTMLPASRWTFSTDWFGFVCCDGFVGLADAVTQRRRYRVNRDPYPGSCSQILQDLSPTVYTFEHMDVALFLGASSSLCVDGGLQALGTAQEGDTLFGFNPHACG